MKLFKNGHIYSDNGKIMNYIIVDKEKIHSLGVNDDYEKENISFSHIVDLQGKTVIPGLWESHLHIIDAMRSVRELNLRKITSVEELKIKLVDKAKALKDGDILVAHGFDQDKIFGGSFPDRKLLDSLLADVPVVLKRLDGHACCLNTKAIILLEMDKCERNEEIPYGEDNFPTGMFFENAMYDVVEKCDSTLSEEYLEELSKYASDTLIENGVTTVVDIRTKFLQLVKIYDKLQRNGDMKVRVIVSPEGEEQYYNDFDEIEPSLNEKLKVGLPKYFIDGTFGSRTALLSENYNDDPQTNGMRLLSDDELDRLIEKNAKENRGFAIHCIGDLATTLVLDALDRMEAKGVYTNLPKRIEHCAIIKDSDIERFKKHNITASFQGVFLFEEDMTRSRVGEHRVKDTYRVKSFIDRGVNTIINCDCPYGGTDFPNKFDGTPYIGYEPLLGIYASRFIHFNVPERITGEQALKCYTENTAKTYRREHDLGTLKAGYLADFIALSHDIVKVPEEDFLKTSVDMTVIGGEIVFTR